MKLDIVKPQQVDAKIVTVHAKVCDSGSYALLGADGEQIGEIDENYVPSFFPGEHYGDYLIFNIDIETGQILNWKKPAPEEVSKAFGLSKDGDE